METIKKQCQELAEKHSYVRKGLCDFLQHWAEATKGVRITAQLESGAEFNEYAGVKLHHHLVTGEDDLETEKFNGMSVEVEKRDSYAHAELSISYIRAIISELPGAIKRIGGKLKESSEKDDEALLKLSKITIAEDKQ